MAVGKLGGDIQVTRVMSAATTNSTSVKGAPALLLGWTVSNTNAAARYLKLYNKAAAPTVGTDTPVMTILLPAGGKESVDWSNGIAFPLGLGLGIVTGVADTDVAAPAVNEQIIHLYWR